MAGNRKKKINERVPRPNMLRPGDLIAIPLTDAEFAYGRVTRCGRLAVLDVKPTSKLQSLRDLKFIQPVVAFFALFYEPVDYPPWIFLGTWPYEDTESGFAPPFFYEDPVNPGHFKMVNKGWPFDITKEEAMLLQPYKSLDTDQLRDRIGAFFAGKWKVTYGLSSSSAAGYPENPSPTLTADSSSAGTDVTRQEVASAHTAPPSYDERLETSKESYPFKRWLESGIDQHTKKSCASCQKILDLLIKQLADLGEGAPEKEKVCAIQKAVETLNKLNEKYDDDLFETSEREELCELFDRIATYAGIDPAKFGNGDGIASEWRDW